MIWSIQTSRAENCHWPLGKGRHVNLAHAHKAVGRSLPDYTSRMLSVMGEREQACGE